jgi:hypothetical protein
MTKEEEKRVNQLIKDIIESDKRLATQLPGEKKHTIVIPLTAIMEYWGNMVKDLESMRDDKKD